LPTKLGHIGGSAEIKMTGLRLYAIPENIGANRIEAHGTCHTKPMLPIFLWDAGEMHFSAADQERLATEKKIALADGKI
jgi:hypothetical protein